MSDLEVAALPTLDRSTIEAWTICPAQAAAIEAGLCKVPTMPQVSGDGAHDAFSYALRQWVENPEWHMVDIQELVTDLTDAAMRSRPDVQPDVMKAIRASVWAWCKFVIGTRYGVDRDKIGHPKHILRFDGGQGEHSGQLSRDDNYPGVIVTSELDLLLSTPAKEVVREIDYKTGNQQWTATDVADSFQFNLHAWLIFGNYEEVQVVETQIWNTRINKLTFTARFRREDEAAIGMRIFKALEVRARYTGKPLEQVPTWPVLDKCVNCPALHLCPAVLEPMRDAAKDLDGFIDNLHFLDALIAERSKLAKGQLKARGIENYITPRGNAFGVGEPSTRAKTMKLWNPKTKEESDGEVGG